MSAEQLQAFIKRQDEITREHRNPTPAAARGHAQMTAWAREALAAKGVTRG